MYALRQFQSNDSWIVHRLEPTNRLVHMIKKNELSLRNFTIIVLYHTNADNVPGIVKFTQLTHSSSVDGTNLTLSTQDNHLNCSFLLSFNNHNTLYVECLP